MTALLRLLRRVFQRRYACGTPEWVQLNLSRVGQIR
jgi:hypothetical protein